jgi:glycosyltransferase involved in cell wall biosynthesis
VRIVVAHNFYKQPGGEDQCVAAEVALLQAHGHQVIQYSVRNDGIDEMRRLNLAARTLWSRTTYRELRELLRVYRPHIAHFHNTFPLISPAAYYAARAEGVGVVQTLHNFRLLCPNALFFRKGKICEECLGRSLPWPGVVYKCYRGSRVASAAAATMVAAHRALGTWREAVDVYVALTEFSRRKIIAGGLPGRKLVVKPNFVHPDPLLACVSRLESTAARETHAGSEYGLFVARLSEEKGLETLWAAWRTLRSRIPLKIVGDGPMAAHVQEAAARDSRIQWLGHRPAHELFPLIGEAMFLAVPSTCYETFGRVIVEAFAMGTPVIASNMGAMAELVDNGRTGLHFKPGDPVDLAANVERLAADPPLRKQMHVAARQEYELNYTAESNYRALLAIYEQALGEKLQKLQIANCKLQT